jgi:hypothetical protein
VDRKIHNKAARTKSSETDHRERYASENESEQASAKANKSPSKYRGEGEDEAEQTLAKVHGEA